MTEDKTQDNNNIHRSKTGSAMLSERLVWKSLLLLLKSITRRIQIIEYKPWLWSDGVCTIGSLVDLIHLIKSRKDFIIL